MAGARRPLLNTVRERTVEAAKPEAIRRLDRLREDSDVGDDRRPLVRRDDHPGGILVPGRTAQANEAAALEHLAVLDIEGDLVADLRPVRIRQRARIELIAQDRSEERRVGKECRL